MSCGFEDDLSAKGARKVTVPICTSGCNSELTLSARIKAVAMAASGLVGTASKPLSSHQS
jgi:hypothetical protein